MNAKTEQILTLLKNNKETILSCTRHTLTALGGALVAKGYVSDGGAEEIIGAFMTLIGAVWGALDENVAEHKAAAEKAAQTTSPETSTNTK